ncbi:hypothetical protein PLESTF_001258900 [Pleodorina starrii]|nr:hypothetical protein PLESTF_001258900 [Pleodorina starrii]
MATRAERRETQDSQRQQKLLARMNPAVATTLLLVRHGQTDWNAEMRLQGHQDPPLNDVGVQQAQELSEVLREEAFDAVYSSDLRRALQTAEAIVAGRAGSMQIRTSAGLRERKLGVLEGLTLPEAAARQPDAFRLLRLHDETTAVPGGESPNQMRERVVAELEGIASEHPGQTVLVVAHGGVLHAVYRQAVGHPYNGPIANASLHQVRLQGRVWAVVDWNVTRESPALGSFGGGVAEG